jgi:hypothetical protein
MRISDNMKVKSNRIKFRRFLTITRSFNLMENRTSEFASSGEKENWFK